MSEMKIPLLRLKYTEEEIAYIQDGVKEILLSGYLTMSEKVRRFEESFAAWVGCKYAIGTNSGTSSLEIILRTIGVEGKTVICPSNTYMATPIAAVHAGARVAFVDSRVADLQMDLQSLKAALAGIKDAAAVMIVHIGGIISPEYWKIKSLCDSYGVPLVEDAAHAHGATIDGRHAGSISFAGSFSFYPTKVLVTAEGGMITTDNVDVYNSGIILREHGKADHKYNIHTEFGYNWRFSELHALLGLQQMKIADRILEERRAIAGWYDELLGSCNAIKTVKVPDNIKPSYYKYICYLDEKIDRDAFKSRMKEEFGVSLTGEVYSDPCHTQPVFKKYARTIIKAKGVSFDGTDYICAHHICPPLYPGLTREEVEYAADCIKKCAGCF